LAVCTLSDIIFVFGRLELFCTAIYICYSEEDSGLQRILKRLAWFSIVHIPGVCNRVPNFLSFDFDFFRNDGVVNIFNSTLLLLSSFSV
jgi:hypothetical protein